MPDGFEKDRIQTALDDSTVSSEEVLRVIVAGLTRKEITSLLAENLDLNELDASALAGLLFTPTGRA